MRNTLDWPDLWGPYLQLKRDNAGRWAPGDATPDTVARYCYQYRSPSRAWPHSYAKPLLTRKFARYLCENDVDLARKLQLID